MVDHQDFPFLESRKNWGRIVSMLHMLLKREQLPHCIVGYAYHQQYIISIFFISPQNNARSNNMWFGEKQGQALSFCGLNTTRLISPWLRWLNNSLEQSGSAASCRCIPGRVSRLTSSCDDRTSISHGYQVELGDRPYFYPTPSYLQIQRPQ